MQWRGQNSKDNKTLVWMILEYIQKNVNSWIKQTELKLGFLDYIKSVAMSWEYHKSINMME